MLCRQVGILSILCTGEQQLVLMLEAPDLITKLGRRCISSELMNNLAVYLARVLNGRREPAFLGTELNEGIQYGDLVFRTPNPGRPLLVLRVMRAGAALGAALGGLPQGQIHRARADGLDVGRLDAGGAARARQRRGLAGAVVFGGGGGRGGVVGLGVGVEARGAPRGRRAPGGVGVRLGVEARGTFAATPRGRGAAAGAGAGVRVGVEVVARGALAVGAPRGLGASIGVGVGCGGARAEVGARGLGAGSGSGPGARGGGGGGGSAAVVVVAGRARLAVGGVGRRPRAGGGGGRALRGHAGECGEELV